jgi:purine-binding chemotaxis protein CheW
MSANDAPGRDTGTPGTPGNWEQLARNAAEPVAQCDEALLLRELLAFELAGDPYAVPVERVREIVRLRPITPMPRVPEAVLGVIVLRGEVIEVIDLRRRLSMPGVEPTRRSRIIVLHGEDGCVAGLLVDAVNQVLRLPEDAIAPSAQGDSEAVEALYARGEEFVSLIDLEKVLDVDVER